MGSKGGGGSQSTTTVQQNFSPEEAARRAAVMKEADRVYWSTMGTASNSPYPGARPITPSAETAEAQTMMADAARGNMQTIADNAMYAQLMGYNAADVTNNPFLDKAMNAAVRPLTEQMTESGGVLSQIRSGAGDAGQYGGSRQGIAEGLALKGYLNAVGDVTAKMGNNAYNTGLATSMQALGLTPTVMGAQRDPAAALSAVGAQREDLAADVEAYRAAQEEWKLNAPWMPLQNYANIVFGGASPGTTTSSVGPGVKGPSRAMGALGGAAMGATVAGPWGAAAGALIGAFM